MTRQELSQLTDEELQDLAKKMKNTTKINSALIGFMIGILIYSAFKNSLGWFSLIPLFFIYKMINRTDRKAIEEIMRERNLN